MCFIYTAVPFTDNPHCHIFNFVNVLLYCSPLATDDTPSLPIALLPMSSCCSELLTFNNSPRQLAPVCSDNKNHYYTQQVSHYFYNTTMIKLACIKSNALKIGKLSLNNYYKWTHFTQPQVMEAKAIVWLFLIAIKCGIYQHDLNKHTATVRELEWQSFLNSIL